MRSWRAAGENIALLGWHICVALLRAFQPPLTQQRVDLVGQHDLAVFGAFALHDANDLALAINVADLGTDNLTSSETAAIGQRQHRPGLERDGACQQMTRLALAEHQRHSLGLAQMIDLSRKIMTAKCYAKQKLHTCHDAVAIADAGTALDQVKLVLISARLG